MFFSFFNWASEFISSFSVFNYNTLRAVLATLTSLFIGLIFGPIMIKFPYLSSMENYADGIQVWEAIILTLSIGVFIGFIIALFQIISQKTEIISQKSKIRQLSNELSTLRNQSIDDDIDLEDSTEDPDQI